MAQYNYSQGRRPSQTFYHYTSRTAADKILDTGIIRPSTDTVHDAMAGPGTYLTTLDPGHSPMEILENNYDSTAFGKMCKTNVAIEMKLPRSQVMKVPVQGRNVYVKEGGVILSRAEDVQVHVREYGEIHTYQWDPYNAPPVLNPNTYKQPPDIYLCDNCYNNL